MGQIAAAEGPQRTFLSVASRARQLADERYVQVFCALAVTGVAIRVALAFSTTGVAYDLNSLRISAQRLLTDPLHFYSLPVGRYPRWPYPGGFLPILLLCRGVANATGGAFMSIARLPAILADVGIAFVVQYGLGQMGASRPTRLTAAALVLLGPSFVLVSGYNGQIDGVAILPALLGVVLWQTRQGSRAIPTGLLIGLGAAVKAVPLFMLLAVLPTARSRREALVLVAAALAVPLVSVLPFLIGQFGTTVGALHSNHGIPGFGGISLIVQPDLLNIWLHGTSTSLSGLSNLLFRGQNLIVGAAVLAAGAVAYRLRLRATDAAVLIWLAVYVANPAWAFGYWIWGLPFFLLAGRLREAAALQLALLFFEAVLWFHVSIGTLGSAYIPLNALMWLAMLAALVVWTRRMVRGPAVAATA